MPSQLPSLPAPRLGELTRPTATGDLAPWERVKTRSLMVLSFIFKARTKALFAHGECTEKLGQRSCPHAVPKWQPVA